MYSHDLRTPTNPNHPEEIGYCDFCQFKYPLAELRWVYDFIGPSLQNLRLRACPRDWDLPRPFLKPVRIVGPEGVVKDARPFQTAGGYNSVGPTPPILPSFPLAETIEGDIVPTPPIIAVP